MTRIDPAAPGDALYLHPDWALEEQAVLDVTAWRALSGVLTTTRWRRFASIRLPMSHVTSAAASRIAAWWRDGAVVALTLDTALPQTTIVCRFAGGRLPLSRRKQAAGGFWAGILELESVDEGFRRGQPFILDDPVHGRLDQPDLSLVL